MKELDNQANNIINQEDYPEFNQVNANANENYEDNNLDFPNFNEINTNSNQENNDLDFQNVSQINANPNSEGNNSDFMDINEINTNLNQAENDLDLPYYDQLNSAGYPDLGPVENNNMEYPDLGVINVKERDFKSNPAEDMKIQNIFYSNRYLIDMLMPLSTKEKKEAFKFRHESFEDIRKRFFKNNHIPYTAQNEDILMMLVACTGQDSYLDSTIGMILDKFYRQAPATPVYSNLFFADMIDNLQRFAPYDIKVRALIDFTTQIIEINNEKIAESGDRIQTLSDDEKASRTERWNNINESFNEIKRILTQNGWDFSNGDDLEFVRKIYDLRTNVPGIGQEIFNVFIDKATNDRIYNVVDKDKVYRSISDYLEEKHYDVMDATAELRDFIYNVRNFNSVEVKRVSNKNAKVTDLFNIINEIGKSANKKIPDEEGIEFTSRGYIQMLKGHENFYDTEFVNESAFKQADALFDKIFADLFKEQKKVSLKAAEMSELDLITSTFKIIKEGKTEPMNLRFEVRNRLVNSGRLLDEEEEDLLPVEIEERKKANMRNMTTLAKLYILHEMADPETKIIYEPHWADNQFTRNEKDIVEYLDINHPKVVKIEDLESIVVEHNTAILEHYGAEKGALYANNYENYVRGALVDKQVIRLRDENHTIGWADYKAAKAIMEENGWDFKNNPTDENYLIMIFNMHNPMNAYHIEVETALKMLLETKITDYIDRNNILRKTVGTLEKYIEKDSLAHAYMVYTVGDLTRNRHLEYRAELFRHHDVPQDTDAYKIIPGVNNDIVGVSFMELQNLMAQKGWVNMDQRMYVLLCKLWNACDPGAETNEGIAYCITTLLDTKADEMTYENMNKLCINMANHLFPYQEGDEYIKDIVDYLNTIAAEASELSLLADGHDNYNPNLFNDDHIAKNQVAFDDNNDIEVANQDGFMKDCITEDNFVYSVKNADFFASAKKPEEIKNDGIQNQYNAAQDIGFMEGESQALAYAYNDYKYLKLVILRDLSDSVGKLNVTVKQAGKDLGAEGTGTELYRNMALALKDCYDKIADPKAEAKSIADALLKLQKESAIYKEARASIFGKRGDGKIRYDEADKWAGKHTDELLIAFNKTVDKLVTAGVNKNVRFIKGDNIKNVNALLTDHKVEFAVGKALGLDEEAKIPRRPEIDMENDNELKNVVVKEQAAMVDRLRKLSGDKLEVRGFGKERVFTEKTLDGLTTKDLARNYLVKNLYNQVMRPDATVGDINNIIFKLDDKNFFDKEVEKISKSKVFARVCARRPKDYHKLFNKVSGLTEELMFESKEYLEGVHRFMAEVQIDNQNDVEAGKENTAKEGMACYNEYIIPSAYPLDDPNMLEEILDGAHNRIAQLLTSKIVAGNEELARAICLDAIERKTSTFDIMEKFRTDVKSYLVKKEVLKDVARDIIATHSVDRVKLEQIITDGTLLKKVAADIDKNAALARKEEAEKKAAGKNDKEASKKNDKKASSASKNNKPKASNTHVKK